MTQPKSVRLHLLLGTPVTDVNGERVGRIEEIAATMQDGEMIIDCYIVGRYGLASRMSFGTSLHWVARILGYTTAKGHVIPWDQLDLSDPANPRTMCAREDLKTHG